VPAVNRERLEVGIDDPVVGDAVRVIDALLLERPSIVGGWRSEGGPGAWSRPSGFARRASSGRTRAWAS
jgi:hypothetical protein